MFLFLSGSSQSLRADFYDIDFLSIRRRLHAGLAQMSLNSRPCRDKNL